MAINFSAQFIVNEKTSTRVLRLTDTSTGFTLSKGNFIITFPDGSVASNTDFANPQITAPGGNTSVSLITDVDNTVLTGTYVITYVALNTSLNEFTKTETFDFNWEKPAKAIINDSDVVLPEVQFKDLTAYETSGSFTGVLTRNFYTTTPSTSEVGVITKTSAGDILTPSNASKYYEGIYLAKSDISVAYTHTSKSWLTVAYTDLLQETFDVREAPTQDELVALMNTYKDQIEAYKSTNPSQYEIMNEQYDLVLALYSHILARYQTNTLDGSKAILDQLLGLLPPASSYTYKATQMLPFTINFSTSLTGTGTTGTVPKFTGTTTLGDSIIRESGGMIGIAKAPTAVLDVSGTIKGTSIVKDGGTSAQFLKADGSVDANTYLTTGSAASSYQPLDADLTAIAVLAGAAGILTKVSANTWTLDTTSYQVLDADLTAIASLAGTSGFLKKTSANTWELDTTSYQVLDADLTAIAALTGTSGILIKTAANTWSLDTATYQLADADLTAIAALAGTSGLIRKTAANTYELDTSAYLTGITSGQITTALGYTPENAANKGVNNGYAGLDGTGKVPSTQLPSYVDDVIEAANLAALPATGETGKIYITLDTNKVYRWTGSVYVEISSSTAVWGGITGTLSNQTDLQSALDAKLSTTSAASTYVPYSGATGAVNLGAYDLKVNELTIGKGTSSLSNNTALGHDALFHITSGNYNTGVGHEALHNTSSGAYNTAIGQSALFTNTSGAQNTAIGLNALLSNTSGGSNTALGLDSLQHNTSGSSNVALGYNAGSHITGGTTPNTTSATSIYIGRDTRASADGGANEIVIGNATTGNGSNTVTIGNSSITANYLKGSVNAGSFVKSGGTSAQFLKADGSVDENAYATTAQLDLKANILNPVFTDNIYISGTNPRLYFTDTDTNPDYTIFVDSGVFYILNQTVGEARLSIAETGNISAGIGKSMVATSFIKRGGTSSEFLMADGSVTSGAVVNYPGIGIAVSGGGGWLTSIDDNSANWNAAYSARISSLVTSRSSGSATFVSNILDIPTYTISGLGGQPAFASGTGFVKISGTTISYVDETYYLASNPSGYTTNAGTVTSVSGTGTVSGLTLSGTVTSSGSLTLGGTIALASGDVTTALGFMPVSPSSLSSYLPLTGGALANTLSSGYVLSVTNNGTAADSNGLYVNIDTASTGTPFKVARGGVSLINVNYLGATVLKSTITAIAFIKSSGTSSEYLMADGSVSTGLSFTYPGAGIVTSTGSAWGTSITDNSNNWNTAFSWGNHAGVYLPLSGGTLTGPLGGTSASFSGTVTSTTGTTGARITLGGFTNYGVIQDVNSVNRIWFENTGSYRTIFDLPSAGTSFVFRDYNGNIGVTITAAGNVGIGTTSIGVRLVNSGATLASVPTLGSGTIGADAILSANGLYGLYTGVSSEGWVWQQVQRNDGGTAVYPLILQPSGGNVGIGTTAPAQKLEVNNGASTAYVLVYGRSRNLYLGQDSIGAAVYSGGDAPLYFATNDSERMRITSGGNVGIGTTAPQTILSIETSGVQNTVSPIITAQSSGTTYTGLYSIRDGAGDQRGLIFQVYTANVGLNEKMRITSSGNVGIGTTAPTELLEVKSANPIISINQTTNTNNSGIRFKTNDTQIGTITAQGGAGNMDINMGVSPGWGGYIVLKTDTVERMRITSGGELLINGTYNPYPISTRGNITLNGTGSNIIAFTNNSTPKGYFYHDGTDLEILNVSGGIRFYANNSLRLTINTTTAVFVGAITATGSVTASSFFESSDKNLKTLIEDNYQSKGIESITAKLYTKNGVAELGYFAQDVQSILPSAVTTGADGFLNLSYREVHTAKIARLEKRVEELEAQLKTV